MSYEIVSVHSGFSRNRNKYIQLNMRSNNKSTTVGVFCVKCRSINLGAAQSCQFCGASFVQKCPAYIENHIQTFGRKKNIKQDVFTVDNIHESVTIGVSKDDDNNIESINMTLWYRTYVIDALFRGQRSYQTYFRITMQLKTRQLIVSQIDSSRKVHYTHFNIWHEAIYHATRFAGYYKSDYARMLNYYLKSLGLSLPKYKTLSPALLYWYIRYPIVMDMCSVGFLNYLNTLQSVGKCGVDIYLLLIHSVCKSDRVINHLMQSRTYDEFIEQYKQVLGEWYENSMNIDLYSQPMLAVIAYQMKHMGFKKFSSVNRVLDKVIKRAAFGYGTVNDSVSPFIFDLFRQRTHVTNKFFKRFIKAHGEDTAVDMFVNFGIVASNGFKLQVDYYHYQNRDESGLERPFMHDFWKYIESNFDNIDFNKSLSEIYVRDFLMYNSDAFDISLLNDAVRRSTSSLSFDGRNFDEYYGGEKNDL